MPRLGKLPLFLVVTAFASVVNAQARPQSDSERVSRNVRMLQFIQGFQMANSAEFAPAINSLLQDDGAHMRMAPVRPAEQRDSDRAANIVKTARAALAKYADVRVAEADGYVKFLPFVDDQIIYHYNNFGNVMALRTGFDVTRPVSLLYKKDDTGVMKLVGAMYSAMPNATPEELDARLPTRIARWHEHVNFCAASPDSVRTGAVKLDGPTVSHWLAITTAMDCSAAGGRFIPRMFGWMAHVYMFAGDDPKVTWGEAHGSMDVHMHHPPMTR